MPYDIQKRGSKYCLIRKDGSVKQCHDSKKDAQGARRAIMMTEHGGKK